MFESHVLERNVLQSDQGYTHGVQEGAEGTLGLQLTEDERPWLGYTHQHIYWEGTLVVSRAWLQAQLHSRRSEIGEKGGC